jgi:hypothetical protein
MIKENEKEDLVAVLTEFYQRGQRERERDQTTGIPKPFELTTSVQSLGHVAQVEPRRVVDTPLETGVALVKPETEFDFGQYSYVATSPFSFRLEMQLSCHNTVPTDPLSIYVAEAIWFGPQHPPVYSGNLSMHWDYDNWWPAVKDAPPTIPVLISTTAGAPNLVPNWIRVRFSLRHTRPPYDWVRTIFYAGERPEVWTVRNNVFPADIQGLWSLG